MPERYAPPKYSAGHKRLRTVLTSWQLYLLILPAVVYAVVFFYMPMYGVVIAFKDFRPNRGILGSGWVGLKHFVRFITYPDFWNIISNTARISIYSFFLFPLPVILALMINELRNKKFKKTVQIITYAPHFISTIVVTQMIAIFFHRSSGLVNNFIEILGGERIAFMEVGAYFPHLYVWSDVWQHLGWDAIIYIAALAGVSSELVEAALIDGAKKHQIIWHINVATIMPTIIIMLILRCGAILSVGFEKTFLLQNALNLTHSQVISTYTYQVGLLNSQYSYSAAVGLFNTVINVFVLLIVNTIARRVSEISLW